VNRAARDGTTNARVRWSRGGSHGILGKSNDRDSVSLEEQRQPDAGALWMTTTTVDAVGMLVAASSYNRIAHAFSVSRGINVCDW
jgi:hypothetical protein